MTQQGQIYKRHLRALMDLILPLESAEESLIGRYPEPLGYLIGYGLDRHLIDRQAGQMKATQALSTWVDQPTWAKQVDLYRYWQSRFGYQNLESFLAAAHLIGARWFSLDRLIAELEPLVNPSQRASFPLRLKHHLSTFLAPLGLFELGRVGESGLAGRLTPAGRAALTGEETAELPTAPDGQLVLEATFEILAARPVPPRVLWRLEMIADLVHRTDRTLIYRLSRQSIYGALRKGLTGDEIIRFLRAHSATGVPQNVAFDLEAWSSQYGQVYLQSVTLLRCASALLAEQIKASRRTSPFVLGQLTPTDLIVIRDRQKELLEALEADGLMPRPDLAD